jgi:hypothetical protein
MRAARTRPRVHRLLAIPPRALSERRILEAVLGSLLPPPLAGEGWGGGIPDGVALLAAPTLTASPQAQGYRIWKIRRMRWSRAAGVLLGRATSIPTSILLCSRSDSFDLAWTRMRMRNEAAEKAPEFHMRLLCPLRERSRASGGRERSGASGAGTWRPFLPQVERWYRTLQQRPAYREHVARVKTSSASQSKSPCGRRSSFAEIQISAKRLAPDPAL